MNAPDSLSQHLERIRAMCQNDEVKSEVAISNLEQLITVMEKYERAPRYYNSSLSSQYTTNSIPTNSVFPIFEDTRDHRENKVDVYEELRKLYGVKLKLADFQALVKELSSKAGLKVDRETKRCKSKLIEWFQINWNTIHMKIYEHSLQNMTFPSKKTDQPQPSQIGV